MKTKKLLTNSDGLQALLSRLADVQLEVKDLPKLSSVEKAKFEHALAIEQLYYSSKIEGSTLTDAMIDKAIHGEEFSPSSQ
jgi:hypothetical protein